MRGKQIIARLGIAVALTFGVFGTQVFAQHTQQHDMQIVGKEGMVTFNKHVRAGAALLKPGMYHVRHIVEGSEHVVTFKPVTMPAGYRQYQMVEGREVARLKCTVEPAAKKTRNTKVVLGRNAAGETAITEVQIAGENVRHKF